MYIGKYDEQTGKQKGYFWLTDDVAQTIARWNERLTTADVRSALEDGKRVYTYFSYWEALKPQPSMAELLANVRF